MDLGPCALRSALFREVVILFQIKSSTSLSLSGILLILSKFVSKEKG
ncbi:MAG: hypothetical protein ABIJ58_00500 [Nanoarchaeota archaeon]